MCRWLDTLALSQYKLAFREASIDGDFLLNLREEDMRDVLVRCVGCIDLQGRGRGQGGRAGEHVCVVCSNEILNCHSCALFIHLFLTISTIINPPSPLPLHVSFSIFLDLENIFLSF